MTLYEKVQDALRKGCSVVEVAAAYNVSSYLVAKVKDRLDVEKAINSFDVSLPPKEFTVQARDLINSLPTCTGDTARLAHFLSEAVSKLEAVFSQADAQFNAGFKGAAFNIQEIRALKEKE